MTEAAASPEATGDLPIGVITVDTALVVGTWSAWVESASGIAASDAHGQRLGEVIPEIAARGLLAHFQRVAETGEAQVLAPAFHHYLIACAPRTPAVHFDRMQQLVTLGALREGERIVGVMATIEDVTARLDAERTLAHDLRSGDPAVRERAMERLQAVERLHQPGAFVDVLKVATWQVRRSTVQGLARHASRDLLASLMDAMRHEHHDFSVLGSALQLLSMIDVDVTAPLVALLQDPDADLRMQAALALGDQPNADSGAALIAALSDEDVNVRFHAIESLGRLQWNDAVEPLAAIAESRDFFLAFPAVDALSRIADPRVAPRLIPLLEDEALAVPAAEALGRLAGGEAVRPLVRVLDGRRPPVTAVASAIAALYDQYQSRYGGGEYIVAEFRQELTPAGAERILAVVADASREDLRSLVLLLGWVEGPAVERALTELLGRPDLRADVIEALVRRGTAVVTALMDQLESEDRDVELAAIAALGRLGDKRATGALSRLLVRDRAVTVAAAGALAHIGDLAAVDPLFARLTDPDSAIRQAVIGALSSLGDPDMRHRLAPLLRGASPYGRESAVRIAGYFGFPECVDAILACCDDPDEAVRRAALEQLPLILDEQALPLLKRAIEQDTPRARGAAAAALGKVAGAEARAVLHTALADPDAWVRYFAARSLAQHRHDSALDALARLAGSDPAPHVRIAALNGIGAIGGPNAAALLASHTDDEDPVVGDTAVTALGQIADETALAPLLGALRSSATARRTAAVAALSERGGREGIAALHWTAAGDVEDAVADAALQGLGRLAARASNAWEEAVDALLELTRVPARREPAIAALSRVPPSHMSRLAAGMSHAISEVRRAAVEALSRIKAPSASERVREALNDEDDVVREAAVVALDRIGTRGLSSIFVRMANNDPAVEVRRVAAAASMRHGGGSHDSGPR